MQVGAPLLDSVRFPPTMSINKMHYLSLTHQCKDTDNILYTLLCTAMKDFLECLFQVERYLEALSDGLYKILKYHVLALQY